MSSVRASSVALLLAAALVSPVVAPSAGAAVFQYAVPVPTGRGESRAFLWIPPRAERVRGVVMAGMTLMEREFAKDERIRAACEVEGLAIAFLKRGLASADLQKVLDDLAEVCGYGELSSAPLLFVGHSAGGPQAKAAATRFAARCFGLVQYRGGVPGGDGPLPPGIPALVMVGQFDEFGGAMRTADGREPAWETARDEVAAFRVLDERNLASILVEPGAGHFAWSDRNAAYVALYIAKAARARIPAERPADPKVAVALREVDARQGWLTDLSIAKAGGAPPAPFGEYLGDRARSAWHFDEETARATVAYHAGGFGKKDQFIRWEDPHWVDAGVRHFFTGLKWVGDGATLEVHPVYADRYPEGKAGGQGPRWPGAGGPAGHSAAPILVRPVNGPIVATGPGTLRMRFDALAPATERARTTFMATSAGDAEYRYTEQVGMMPRGFRGLDRGKPQTITFPELADVRADAGPVELGATSDSGLAVEYYVAWGPAVVAGARLEVADLPARARLPVSVKVVAWQFGSGVEPFVRTAAPVERTFRIVKP